MKTATEILALVDVGFCQPLVLIMNFSLFQYLLTTFWTRRCEPRVRLLLFIAALSFVSIIPFAFPDYELTRDLNDMSEVCSVLTFLLQITILTRDVGKRIKIRSLWVLLWIAEVLVVLSVMSLVTNAIDIFVPAIDMRSVEILDFVVENVSLLFIVGFRFYFLSIAKGYRKVWVTQKTEIVFYSLFLTHEIPFALLHHFTGLACEHIQAFWMRTTIVLCLSMTLKARFSSLSSRQGATTGKTTNGPRDSKFESPVNVRKPVSMVPMKSKTIVTAPSLRSIVAILPMTSSRPTSKVEKFTP